MNASPEQSQGVCHVFFAFETGFAIDLGAAQRLLTAADPGGLAVGGRNVAGSDFHPRPVRALEPMDAVDVAGWRTRPQCKVTLYDFGAISVGIEIPLAESSSIDALLALGRGLAKHASLAAAARSAAERVLARVSTAVAKARLAPQTEDYIVYALPSQTNGSAASSLDRHAVARLLRAEEGELSEEEVSDSLANSVSYSPHDVAIIDWNAALLRDSDSASALAVLEFANTELLEMRYLDDELDAALSEAYELSSRHLRRRSPFSKQLARDAARLAELQIDAATLFEAVNNALKLFGDQYLARLHHAAVRRFHTEDYERSVLRKLETLESIYGKMRDSQAQVRAEILEWIIIALITFEVVLGIWRWSA